MLNLKSPAKQLCLDLLHADTEEQVIALLKAEGYWDNPDVWQPFGGREDNFSVIGNQSSNADAALVEKLVNSVDAILMGECRAAGIVHNSPDAPQTIKEAVAQFFAGDRAKAETQGDISNWPSEKRRELSNRITLAATGNRTNPSFTIVDNGEGQTPDSMPNTILSLDKRNKIDVHFVQGKFNMGGTAALRFCGRDNLQLVISRRNPSAQLEGDGDASIQWGFTIVRREDPTASKRVSTYTYLAPEEGGILRFDSDSLPVFPQRRTPYVRSTEWGTAIKLYEYKLTGRSNIILRDGLLHRLDILLPQIALPVRLHECRDYSGHEGSFDTTLTGLGVRLSDDRNENLEPGFPASAVFSIRGQEMTAEIYAFKRGRADTYRKNDGVIFVVNGQTHGNLHSRFFSRRAVGLDSLKDSLLVIVDCSHIDGRSREDLFMNSRDRLEQGEFLKEIEAELAEGLKDNQLLRDLRERRRREDVQSKLDNQKPLQEVLETIIRKSPSMANLFGIGGPLPDPFRSATIKVGQPFVGQNHPSFFRFRNEDYGKELRRTTAINNRSRIVFETDVVNDYFTRRQQPGSYTLRSLSENPSGSKLPNKRFNLEDGVATLNLALPDDAKVGDSFAYELVIEDETLVERFENRFVITVGPYQKSSGGNPRPKPLKQNQGMAIPNTVPVYESEWDKHGFDKNSALKAEWHPGDDGEQNGAHTYYINMDNIHLKTELKATKDDPEIIKARWQFGMVLVGVALLNAGGVSGNPIETTQTTPDDDIPTPEEEVFKATEAIAPVLLPLIEHLGALSREDVG